MSNPMKDTTKKHQGRAPVRGFTLIELMVVILIIGLLATIIVPGLRSARDKALRVKAQADIKELQTALERYYDDAGAYPTSDQGLNALLAAPTSGNIPRDWQGPYVDNKLPDDPWGHPYFYQSDGVNGYTLKSFGPTGVEGGEGKNAGIDGSTTQ
jgi:general secretion pathway protein G